MDEDTTDTHHVKKGLNIELGRELETCSRHSETSPDASIDAIVPQLSRLSINISTGNNIEEMGGVQVADDKESAAIFSRLIHNSKNSFYSDCSSKPKKNQEKLDVNLVRLKPHVSISINSANATHSKRSVNENLNSYMVVRQRTFHGFRRTRREMKTLPLTDPRDVANSPSNWLHRSKTDLYIEKRREKYINQHQKRGKSQIDLDGMTFGYLVQNLPRSRSSGHEAAPRKRCHSNLSARSCPSNLHSDRLPPLTVNRMKQLLQHDIEVIEPHNTTSSSHCESPPQSSSKGKVRKQALNTSTCMPLKIWQPSLDCVFYSRQKELTPRDSVNSVRQQPLPLK